MQVDLWLQQYAQVYRKLHQREPRELRDLGAGWVAVNGMRMPVAELQRLTEHMQLEYRKSVASKRSMVKRLIAWLRDEG